MCMIYHYTKQAWLKSHPWCYGSIQFGLDIYIFTNGPDIIDLDNALSQIWHFPIV